MSPFYPHSPWLTIPFQACWPLWSLCCWLASLPPRPATWTAPDTPAAWSLGCSWKFTKFMNPNLVIVVYGGGSIPINTIFRGMNVHLPTILMFTRGTRFWHTAIYCSGLKLRMTKSACLKKNIPAAILNFEQNTEHVQQNTPIYTYYMIWYIGMIESDVLYACIYTFVWLMPCE